MLARPSVSNQWQSAPKRIVVCCGCVGLSFLFIAGFGLLQKVQAAENTLSGDQVSAAPTESQPKLVAAYGKLPLSFEANQGQVSGAVQFLSRGLGYTLFLTGDEAVLSLGKAAGVAGAGLTPGVTLLVDKPTTGNEPQTAASVLRMKLIGASASAAVTGAEELPGKSNYFIGNDPSRWRTNLPNYAQVKYQNVYPGVDLVYYGTQGGQLEYDFVVAPGADPHSIGLSFQGAVRTRVDKRTGDLVLALDGSELRFRKPVVYQPASGPGVPGGRRPINARFVLTGRNQIGFQVAAYDRRAPLIIDPVLIYSTYLGGGKYTVGYRVAVDASGNAYVAGGSNSSDFPTTAGVYSSTMNPGACVMRTHGVVEATWPCGDAFVAKLDPTGTQLVYSTYLGGSATDGATGISVDGSGNAYVTGSTSSRDFPTTTGAFQTSATDTSWRTHAFAAKLNPAGSALLYSTYLAGTHDDVSTTSALDSSGYLYVAGGTTSKDFPTTAGAFQTAISGTSCSNYEQQWPCPDGFISKLNQTGTGLVYSTFLGGSSFDAVLGLAVDSTGSAYVTGVTASTNFPTANALQSSFGTTTCGTTVGGNPNPRPCFHAFVTKLNSSGTALDYSTYLGGNGYDAGIGIAVDGTGAAYVTGATNSTQFPTTAGAAQTTFGGGTCYFGSVNSFDCSDAFVAKLEPSGTALAYSTYLGGSSFDLGWSIAVDSAENAYVVGGTNSLDFPTDANTGNFQGGTCSTDIAMFILSSHEAGSSFNCPNAFLTEIDPTGATRLFSTYLGGASGDLAFSVAVDGLGGTYVAGSTLSFNFPITTGALQTSITGYADAFLSKFGPASATGPVVSLSSPLTFSAQVEGTTSSSQTVTLTNTGNGSLTLTAIAATGPFAIASSGTTCSTSTPVASQASCTVAVTFTPTAVGSASGSLSFTDNAPNSPQALALSGTGQDFTVTPPSGSSTSATTAPGSPATYTLSVSGEGGASGTVAFICTGAPSEATCTVSPNPAPTGTNVTVTVTTTAPSVSAPRSGPLPPVPPLSPGLRGLLMLALVLASMAWAIVRGNQADVRQWRSTIVPLAAGLLLTLTLAGCHSSSPTTTTTSNAGTPAGTYTLTVTGTAGSGTSAVSHNVTLTLIVS